MTSTLTNAHARTCVHCSSDNRAEAVVLRMCVHHSLACWSSRIFHLVSLELLNCLNITKQHTSVVRTMHYYWVSRVQSGWSGRCRVGSLDAVGLSGRPDESRRVRVRVRVEVFLSGSGSGRKSRPNPITGMYT